MKVREYLENNLNDIVDLPIVVVSDIGITKRFDSVKEYLKQNDFIDCFNYAGAAVQLDINGEDSFVILYTKNNFNEV